MPNSILWTGLVILWLFVLFPMLADRHPRIRRTTDAALATRVLHRGGSKRKKNRDSPDADRQLAEVGSQLDPGYWKQPRAYPAVGSPRLREPVARGLEPEWQPGEFVPDRRGRGGFDREADWLTRHARYRFRRRAVTALLSTGLISGVLAMAVAPLLWWVCVAALGVLTLYLIYLRRQARLEEEIRRRRITRAERVRHADLPESTVGVDAAPQAPADRQRHFGMTVLEIDEPDLVFEHLDPFVIVEQYPEVPDIRRAVGQ